MLTAAEDTRICLGHLGREVSFSFIHYSSNGRVIIHSPFKKGNDLSVGVDGALH